MCALMRADGVGRERPSHDHNWGEWMELLREVIRVELHLGLLVCEDEYLIAALGLDGR